MKPIYSQEQIEEMRKRLYERGTAAEKTVRHEYVDEKIDVSRNWSAAPSATPPPASVSSGDILVPDKETLETAPKRKYRSFILSGSFLIFMFVAIISSLYMYFGGNQISSGKVQIAITGQSFIGGGEVMTLQVAVTNENTVPIESATIIIKYPTGTRSVGDAPRNLFEERITIGEVAPGAVETVPVKIAVFGEENAEKSIEASIEYRIEGTSSMLDKEAAPLAFRLSSAPLVLRIENVQKVASGQLVDVIITAVSNASTPLENILITAAYPTGFDFETASPAPIHGENVWRIDSLLPEQSTTIRLQGVVIGLTDETFRINFSAGPANNDNQYLVAAALAQSWADFLIERPFIDIKTTIDGDSSRLVTLSEDKEARVKVVITNTLDETVYDMAVAVVPGGNALTEASITSTKGYYDSNTGTVRWEVSNNENFDRVLPGDTRTLEFSVQQGPTKTASSFDLVVNVYARRVAEESAVETLIGTARAEAKYSSNIAFGSQAGRNVAGFVDTGPVPPKAEKETTYTLTLVATAGANDLVNALVETSLPLYVDWLDMYDTEGTLTYNSVSKKIQWSVGNIAAREQKTLTFQVSMRPSVSQVDVTPVLLNKQSLRANDRFTGALLQGSARAVTTELSEEMGFARDNGKVVR